MIITRQLADMQKELDSLKIIKSSTCLSKPADMENSVPKAGEASCFYCHEKNHFIRDCPKLLIKFQQVGKLKVAGGKGSTSDTVDIDPFCSSHSSHKSRILNVFGSKSVTTVTVNRKPYRALVDTGAEVTTVCKHLISESETQDLDVILSVRGASGSSLVLQKLK